MPRLLLIVAAAVAFPSVAAAQSFVAAPAAAGSPAAGFVSSHGVRIFRGTPDGDRPDRRRAGDVVVVGGYGWSGGEWALYNNRTFAPDSFNDWWHDRPDRSMPRWLSDNQRCERVWSSGAGWRC